MRKFFLGAFVISWMVTDALFWAAGLKIWATLWIVALAAVIGHEIWAVLTGKGKTISTRLGHTIENKPLIGWTILASMGTSWIMLLLHLGWGR